MPTVNTQDRDRSQDLAQEIIHAIKTIRYGSIEITIHDSKVVQIERREKIRLDKESSSKRQL